jgi:hypothetical protein
MGGAAALVPPYRPLRAPGLSVASHPGALTAIDELVFAVSCLAARTGNGYPEAARALSDMTEKRLDDTGAEA